MSKLPFEAEYAKSGRSGCNECNIKIHKGALRIAEIVQSEYFDGKQWNWYHEECFFETSRVDCVSYIGKFNKLKLEDQKRIKKIIEKGKGKGKRSSDFVNSALKNFAVEYSSTSATCKDCDQEIFKNAIRICKNMYVTEPEMTFDKQVYWYHVDCFAQERDTLGYLAGGEDLPGYNSLEEDDQNLLKDAIPSISPDEVPKKKMKTDDDEEETMKEKYLENKMDEQNDQFHKYKDALKVFQKKDLRQLLKVNSQKIPAGVDECLDRLADCMAFGSLEPCPECQGQMVLDNFNYKCTGNITEWTKCSYTSRDPKRKPMIMPEDFRSFSNLEDYKPMVDIRLFEDVKKDMPNLPLKNLQFFLYGEQARNKDVIKRIAELGGLVVSKLTDTTTAVISSKQDIENILSEIQEKDIPVVKESFLNWIDPVKGTVAKTMEIIKLHKIGAWDSDRATPDYVIVNERNFICKVERDSTIKLIIKGGTVVHPDSGLEHVAHVYKDSDGTKYAVTLTKTDVDEDKNSFYILQVLKDDTSDIFWLFRAWGRIGTIGKHKLEDCYSCDDAVKRFEDLYKEKTKGNIWNCRDDFMKVADGYYPVELDYGDDEVSATPSLETACNLPPPVQQLVIQIFDINVMNLTMLEYELDTEKMPLGKLSKKQIKSGYEVLAELLKYVVGRGSLSNIKDATNRFYTMVPHDFGNDNPPLLDTVEAIQKRIVMLDDLLEIEIAYSLLKTVSGNSGSVIEARYLALKAAISPVDRASPEFQLIQEYVTNTQADTHSNYTLEIQQVFKVVREGENKRYEPFRKLHNRRLLWHGSRVTNFAGILSQGLRIAPPEAPTSGYMFGKGIYFADMVTKSANYCCTSTAKPVGIMLLSEVALGNMKECYGAEFITKLPAGTHSVWGVGRTQPDPCRNRTLDNGTVVPLGKPVPNRRDTELRYNEFIVYDVAQVNVEYLLQMKFNYK